MRPAPLFIALLCLSLLGCGKEEKKTIAEAPPLTDSLQAGYNTLYFTIFYPTSDLEDWLNRKFAKVIVDKDIPRETGKDSVRLVVTKARRIRLLTTGDSVDVTFPLQVEIIADKEKKSGRISHRRVTGELDLYLNIKPDVNRNWDIISKSVLKNYEWIKKPQLVIGNAEIGIQFIADHILKKEMNALTDALDKALEEKVNLEKGLNRTWTNLQKPMPILKNDTSLLYFKIDPQTVAGDIKVTRKGFLFRMGVKTRALVHIDSLSLTKIRPLPPFNALKGALPDSNRLEVLATVPLSYINGELATLLQQYKYENKVMQLTVKDICMRGAAEKIVLELAVEGTAEGTITIVGQPVYLADLRVLSIRELDYDLHTDHLLVNLLDKNLKDNLLEYMRQKVVLDVGKYVNQLPDYLNNTINQGRSGEKFHLNFEEIQVENIDYLVNEDNLQILLNCRPKFNISLKRLPVRKQLKIR
ncbi:DUF4403 family protein [Leadbetterella sp. DM7]|uniref:DUF4403 family protein n=1 Tax=Leadbetterella sp. DM7 TaxID=3235085 RepID=UPI00349EBC7C